MLAACPRLLLSHSPIEALAEICDQRFATCLELDPSKCPTTIRPSVHARRTIGKRAKDVEIAGAEAFSDVMGHADPVKDSPLDLTGVEQLVAMPTREHGSLVVLID